MGLFNWNKKKEDIPIEDKGWIKVRLGFYLNGEIPKNIIISSLEKISENLKQGCFFFNSLDNSFGYGSPFVKKPNTIITANFIKTKCLSKSFITKINKDNNNWHVVFAPLGKDSLYKLQELDEDLYILWNVDKDIRERFNLEGNPASFNTGFNGKKPTMEIKWSLMTYEFDVEDGIKYDTNILTKECFGMGVQERIDFISKNNITAAGRQR